MRAISLSLFLFLWIFSTIFLSLFFFFFFPRAKLLCILFFTGSWSKKVSCYLFESHVILHPRKKTTLIVTVYSEELETNGIVLSIPINTFLLTWQYRHNFNFIYLFPITRVIYDTCTVCEISTDDFWPLVCYEKKLLKFGATYLLWQALWIILSTCYIYPQRVYVWTWSLTDRWHDIGCPKSILCGS